MIKKLVLSIGLIVGILLLLAFCKIEFIGKPFHAEAFEPYLLKRGDNTKQVSLTYLGTSGFIIGYKGRQIVCDPYFSNPNLWSCTFGKIPYPKLSTKIDSTVYSHVDLITISHGHYDHCLNIENFLKKSSATKVLADSSILNELHSALVKADVRAEGVSPTNVRWIYSDDSLFRIFPLPSTHSPHIGHLTLFTGNYKEPLESLPSKLWQWKLYQCNSYVIDLLDHENIHYRILIVNGKLNEEGIGYLEKLCAIKNADLFLPVFWSKKVCTPNFERCFAISHPTRVILHHWNNFFRGTEKSMEYMRMTEFPESLEEMHKKNIPATIMLPFSTVEL
jgi:hypothetical protein